MTVKDLIKRLEKIDKDKMCIFRVNKNDEGWSNIGIEEKENEVTIYADMIRPFSDD